MAGSTSTTAGGSRVHRPPRTRRRSPTIRPPPSPSGPRSRSSSSPHFRSPPRDVRRVDFISRHAAAIVVVVVVSRCAIARRASRHRRHLRSSQSAAAAAAGRRCFLLFDCCVLKPEPRARTAHTAATKAQLESARAQPEPYGCCRSLRERERSSSSSSCGREEGAKTKI